jgi:hypothetical protein
LLLEISSSATLEKGRQIHINALGLVDALSPRTQFKARQANGKDADLDLRDGIVYFGSKKSIKVN